MTTPTSTSGNTAPEGDGALIQSLLRALGAFRAVALTWAIVGLLFSRMYLTEPLAAAIVLAAMAGVTALVTPLPGRPPLLPPDRLPILLLELSIGITALVADGFVYMLSLIHI